MCWQEPGALLHRRISTRTRTASKGDIGAAAKTAIRSGRQPWRVVSVGGRGPAPSPPLRWPRARDWGWPAPLHPERESAATSPTSHLRGISKKVCAVRFATVHATVRSSQPVGRDTDRDRTSEWCPEGFPKEQDRGDGDSRCSHNQECRCDLVASPCNQPSLDERRQAT